MRYKTYPKRGTVTVQFQIPAARKRLLNAYVDTMDTSIKDYLNFLIGRDLRPFEQGAKLHKKMQQKPLFIAEDPRPDYASIGDTHGKRR